MRENIVYSIYAPKQMMGTDRKYCVVILYFAFLFVLVTRSWIGFGVVASICLVAIRYGQLRSKKDIWWYKLQSPYQRYADIYVPWSKPASNPRYMRPYGFGRGIKS